MVWSFFLNENLFFEISFFVWRLSFMVDGVWVVLLVLLVGVFMFIGGFIVCFENFCFDWLESEFCYVVIVFGGGVLLLVIVLVFVLEGM